MNATRRTALTLALTVAALLGTAGSTAPAQASFADSATVSTATATTSVVAPTNVVGSLTCTNPATMGVTWTKSTTPRISGYTVSVYFSDGYTQVVELGPNATSWSTAIDPYYVTAFSVRYGVTARTDYGWVKGSTRTGFFQC